MHIHGRTTLGNFKDTLPLTFRKIATRRLRVMSPCRLTEDMTVAIHSGSLFKARRRLPFTLLPIA
jgi:hypothetical protein